MPIYGYKECFDEHVLAVGKIIGFVRANNVKDAMKHFGVKRNCGYTRVMQVTWKQMREGIRTMRNRRDRAKQVLNAAKNEVDSLNKHLRTSEKIK